jgi:hypothetical protein
MSGQISPHEKRLREQEAISDRIVKAPDLEKAKICIVEFNPFGFVVHSEPR